MKLKAFVVPALLATCVATAPVLIASPAFADTPASQSVVDSAEVSLNAFDLSDAALTGHLIAGSGAFLHVTVEGVTKEYTQYVASNDFSIDAASIFALKPQIAAGDVVTVRTTPAPTASDARVVVTGTNPEQPIVTPVIDAFTRGDTTLTGTVSGGVKGVYLRGIPNAVLYVPVAEDSSFSIPITHPGAVVSGSTLTLAWVGSNSQEIAPRTDITVQEASGSTPPSVDPIDPGAEVITGTAGASTDMFYVRINGTFGGAFQVDSGEAFSIDTAAFSSGLLAGDVVTVEAFNPNSTDAPAITSVTVTGTVAPITAPVFSDYTFGDPTLEIGFSSNTRSYALDVDDKFIQNLVVTDGKATLNMTALIKSGIASEGSVITITPQGAQSSGPSSSITL